MKYKTNFYRDTALNGNAIKQGVDLVVDVDGVSYIQAAVYHEGFPIQAQFDDNRDGIVQVKFRLVERVNGQYQPLPKGTYVLKIRHGYGAGVNDEFFIA